MAGAGAGNQALIDLTRVEEIPKLTFDWKPTNDFKPSLTTKVTYHPTKDGAFMPDISGLFTPERRNHGLGNLSRLNGTVLNIMLQFLGFPFHIVLSTTSHGAMKYLRSDFFIRPHLPTLNDIYPQKTLPVTCRKWSFGNHTDTPCMAMTQKEFKFVTDAIPLSPSAKTMCRNPDHATRRLKTVEHSMFDADTFVKNAKKDIEEKKEDTAPPTLIEVIPRFALILPHRSTLHYGKKGTTVMKRMKTSLARRKEARIIAIQKEKEKRKKKLENTKKRFSPTKYATWSEDTRDRHVRAHMYMWDAKQSEKTKGTNYLDKEDKKVFEKAQLIAAVEGLIAGGIAKRQKIA